MKWSVEELHYLLRRLHRIVEVPLEIPTLWNRREPDVKLCLNRQRILFVLMPC